MNNVLIKKLRNFLCIFELQAIIRADLGAQKARILTFLSSTLILTSAAVFV